MTPRTLAPKVLEIKNSLNAVTKKYHDTMMNLYGELMGGRLSGVTKKKAITALKRISQKGAEKSRGVAQEVLNGLEELKTASSTGEFEMNAKKALKVLAALTGTGDVKIPKNAPQVISFLKKMAAWEEGETEDDGWNPGKVKKPAPGEKEVGGEGSMIPGLEDRRANGDEIEARFEEGKPADPTKNMSPAQKKKWKAENKKHRDQFKKASLSDEETLYKLMKQEAQDNISEFKGIKISDLDLEVTPEIRQKAEAWDNAIEDYLTKFFEKKENWENVALEAIPSIDFDDTGGPEAQDVGDLVNHLMELRGGAGFLYYMEKGGEGVGTWDSPEWDKVTGGLTEELSEGIKNDSALHKKYEALNLEIMNTVYDQSPGELFLSSPATFKPISRFPMFTEAFTDGEQDYSLNLKEFKLEAYAVKDMGPWSKGQGGFVILGTSICKCKIVATPNSNGKAIETEFPWEVPILIYVNPEKKIWSFRVASQRNPNNFGLSKMVKNLKKEGLEPLSRLRFPNGSASFDEEEIGNGISTFLGDNAFKQFLAFLNKAFGMTGKKSSKQAGAGGLYGHTKKIQGRCDSASRSLAKEALKIAKRAYGKDPKVSEFLASHQKRTDSMSASLLIDAMKEMGPKFASFENSRKKLASMGYKYVIISEERSPIPTMTVKKASDIVRDHFRDDEKASIKAL